MLLGPKGKAAASQSLSWWVVATACPCYEAAGQWLQMTAHSTRVQGSSAVLHRRVPLVDMCKAATWSVEDTFLKHCALDLQGRMQVSIAFSVRASPHLL